MPRSQYFFVCALILCAGCNTSARTASKDSPRAKDGTKKDFVILKDSAENAVDQPAPAPDAKGKGTQPRKIRYSADMRLIVTNFAEAEEALDAAIKEAKADLGGSEINTSANAVRAGTWRIRVPVEQFHAFRKAVAKIGEIEKNTVDSEDMTDKYYDLEAHIKNREAAREAMRDLLKETGKRDMDQYLKVYDKLENINDEINRKVGQLRLWANLTDLTTVTVHLRERQKFEPEPAPSPAEIPTFGMRASTSWQHSWDLFVAFWQGALIIVIAAAPWLTLAATVLLAGWLITRRARRKPSPPIAMPPKLADS